MSGGMEDCAKLFKEEEHKTTKYDYEKVIDAMHKSWLEYAGKNGMKRNHPSREVYGQLLEHARLWKIAVEELNKVGGVNDTKLQSETGV
jgi:hypothetical protein